MAVSRERLHYQITRAKGVVLVARVDGRVTGGIVCLTHAGQKIARIDSLAVHPDWQGKKIGRRLLKAAIAYARSTGMTAMTLEVNTWNAPAFCLYRSSGFSILETLPCYYFYDDAYRMKMML
jgi:ribosomal protein S18 acetylase RimI-like enzyme